MSIAEEEQKYRPMARKKQRLENFLKIFIVFLILIIAFGAGFLIFRYFKDMNEPPRTYDDYQLRIWQAVLSKNPKDPATLTNIGYVYLKADQPGKAVGYFKQAINYNPKYVPALYNLGIYYKKSGQIKEALAHLKLAAKYAEKGNKYLAFFALGELYQEQKKYDQAINAYNESLADDDGIWNTYQKLGEIYEKQGDNEKALSNYQRAIMFNPDSDDLQEAINRLQGKK